MPSEVYCDNLNSSVYFLVKHALFQHSLGPNSSLICKYFYQLAENENNINQ